MAWLIFEKTSGIFTGQLFSGSDSLLELQLSDQFGAVEAEGVDPLCQRVDPQTGGLVDWQPPAPTEDALQAWSWDGLLRRWISTPTLAALQANALASVDLAIQTAELAQMRPLRELAQAAAAGTAVPQAAGDRLATIDARVSYLRGVRAAIANATSSASLLAIVWA